MDSRDRMALALALIEHRPEMSIEDICAAVRQLSGAMSQAEPHDQFDIAARAGRIGGARLGRISGLGEV